MYHVFLERSAEKDLNRLSFEIHDRVITAIGKLIFNRTITLKDTWAKEAHKS
jgi:hypothetical protein